MPVVIRPPERMPPISQEPVVFTAGPIQGAYDWQSSAVWMLNSLGVNVASPRRLVWPNDGEDHLAEQVKWEHLWLDQAARRGAIMFWLAKEAWHDPTRAYAQTTRFELGEAVTRHRLEGIRVVIGIEEGFTNADYIRFTCRKKAPQIPICDNLPETCESAAYLAKQKFGEKTHGTR